MNRVAVGLVVQALLQSALETQLLYAKLTTEGRETLTDAEKAEMRAATDRAEAAAREAVSKL